MVGTAPWNPDAEVAVRQNLTVVTAVRATHPSWTGPIVLDLISGSVTFDEQWSPHVRASLVCVLPDPAVFEKIDPRDLVRIEIDAGYVYPGAIRDVHLFVNLGLRSRTVTRPDQTLQLVAQSDEALLQDVGNLNDVVNDPGWALNDLIPSYLPLALGFTPAFDLTGCPSTPVPFHAGSDVQLWDSFKEACDVAGAWLRDRGDRTWVVSPWPTTADVSVHSLRAGATGTIVSSEVDQARDNWANTVSVTYVGGTSVTGNAWAPDRGGYNWSTGPVHPPGAKLYNEDRTGSATPAQATAAAAAILRRLLRAGRVARITARSAFWVRPGLTVAITLPAGGTELHLVAQASFDLGRAEMTLVTRQPDNTPISTGA